MKPRLWLLLVCIGWTVVGCQSIRVRSQYDHTLTFSDLHTFCWVPAPAWLHNDPRLHMDILEPLVQNAVTSQLTGKGFRLSDCAAADFQVTFRPALQDRFVQKRGLDQGWGGVTIYEYSPATGGHLYTSGASDTMLYEEREGALVIEILQPQSKRVIWKGLASAKLLSHATVAQREQRARTAVSMVMERFPPPKR